MIEQQIGPIALFGSGETAPNAQRIHHEVMRRLAMPVRAAILETPAGFEPNSEDVAQKIADYLSQHLRNFNPQCRLIPARKRGTSFSTDDANIARPIFDANYIFMGPGSPSYAVRQLQDSYTWSAIMARNRTGAAICFSSATTIAVSKHAMPVYEIYKVGEDLHWKPGLDFFAQFGLELVITPHWNNKDGGDELDTSRCYMGQERYHQLLKLLPEQPTILGIEENTGIVIDPVQEECVVVGAGSVYVISDVARRFDSGSCFDVHELGEWRTPASGEGIREDVWELATSASAGDHSNGAAPDEVVELAQAREDARQARDWSQADALRDRIAASGWQVDDTPEGPRITPSTTG